MKKYIYIAIPPLAFILIISQIILSNELAGERSVIRTLDTEIAELSEEHDLILHEVASASALTTISLKASLAGFIAATKSNIMALGDSYSVAVAGGGTSVQ